MRRRFARLYLVSCLYLAVAALTFAGSAELGVKGEPAPAARTDLYGDPLPPEAVARMGKVRVSPPEPLITVEAVALSPDGRFAATAHRGWSEKAVRLWDAATGKQLWKVEGQNDVYSAAFSPDGKTVAWGREGDGAVRLASTEPDGKPPRLDDPDGPISHVALSPDGKTLAAAKSCQAIRLWNLATGKVVRQIESDSCDFVCLAFSPDGTILAASGDGGSVSLWDAATGKGILHFVAGDAHAQVYSLAFSPDGKVLATEAQDDDCIRLSDAATGKELRRIERITAAKSVREWHRVQAIFSPDGRTIASADTRDKIISLYETATGECRHELRGHVRGVTQVAYSADGRFLVSGSYDDTAILWDLSRPAPPEGGNAVADKPDALWDDLASPDAKRAFRAVRALSAGGASATTLLREKLRPNPPADAKRVKRLISDLNSDDFDERESASACLARLGEIAGPALNTAAKDDAPAETRRRARELLDRLSDGRLIPERLRVIRAIETLERMNTSEARDVLKTLATGSPEARETREARETLARLAKRPAVP